MLVCTCVRTQIELDNLQGWTERRGRRGLLIKRSNKLNNPTHYSVIRAVDEVDINAIKF